MATAVALLLLSCGGGGTFAHHVYRGSEVTYELGPLGNGWRRIQVDDRNDVSWAHEDLAAIVQVNSSCNPELDIPLDALTRHLLIGFTDRQIKSQKRLPFAAREALRTHVRAKLDGVPREAVFHVLKKNGCVYDFALVAPPGKRFSEALSDYKSLIDGFSTRRSKP